MPVVFVHGNPETPAIWGLLLRELSRTDVVTMHLPGFGIPTPPNFAATRDDYVSWLIGELEAIGEPVDLVGHDWGGALTARVACTRPDLLRSWVCDVTGLIHPDYVWHSFAQVWQTPGAGEQNFVDTMASPVQDRVNLFVMLGMTPEIAAELVAASDEEMARCVLALYRSAIQPAMAQWGADAEAAAARPGLALINTADPFVNDQTLGEEMGHRMGARVEIMQDMGHWWMMQDPKRSAEVLEQFWASL